MKINACLVFVYTLILLTGGIIGYVRAGSLPSIIVSAAFSIAFVISAILMILGNTKGYYIALALITLLTAFFLYRFAATNKWMPAGMMIIIGFIIGIILLWNNPIKLLR